MCFIDDFKQSNTFLCSRALQSRDCILQLYHSIDRTLIIQFFQDFLLSFSQESQDESALLWLDEIQRGINDSNNNIKEAAACKH